MEVPSIALRPGRTWRHNPAFRAALAGPGDPGEAPVLDVFHVIVDGVDLAATVPEDRVFRVMSDLGRAVTRLAEGAPKASLTFGVPPVELVLVRHHREVCLTLVVLGPHPQVQVQDLPVEAGAFFEAVAEGLALTLSDLEAAAPHLAGSDYTRRLLRTLRHLRRRPPETVPAGRPAPARAESLAHVGRGPEVTCGFELEDADDRLTEVVSDPGGDLHSLLVSGRVHLHAPDGREIATWTQPPVLVFRSLLAVLRDGARAWAEGEQHLTLDAAGVRLVLDPSGERLEGPGGVLGTGFVPLATTFLGALLDFVAAVTRRAPAQAHNPWLVEMAEEAAALLAHLRQAQEGDLVGHVAAAGPQPTPRAPSQSPLSPWRPRRVRFRRQWSFDAGPLADGGLGATGRRLLVLGEDGAFALERPSGATAWAREGVRAGWLGPRRTDPILLAGPLGLDLVTPSGGTAWSRPLPATERVGLGSYLAVGGCLVTSLDGRTVTGLEKTDGTVRWRFAPPAASRLHLSASGWAVAATDAGFAYGLAPDTGAVRWRVGIGHGATHPPVLLGEAAILLGEGASGPLATVLTAATGAEARVHALPLDGVGRPQVYGGHLWLPGRVADEAAVVRLGAGPPDRLKRISLPGLEGIPRLTVHRQGLLVSDRSGQVAAFDREGRRLWHHTLPPQRPEGHPPPPLLVARDLVLAAHEGVWALDPETGRALGSLHLEGSWGATHLLADDRLNLVVADEDGAITACSLATHLSVVG